MKAIILAAGFGTRLRPLSQKTAKPALPFFHRSVIGHLVYQLKQAGIRDIAINLHHAPASIRRVLRNKMDRSDHLHFSFEPKILGTGGVLGPLLKFIGNDPFVLINGDVLMDISISNVIATHRQNRSIATLVLHPPSVSQGFPPLGGSNDGTLTRFPYGNLKTGDYQWCGTFTGLHIIEPRLLQYVQPGTFQSITQDLYARALSEGSSINVYRHMGYWNDIGTPERYMDAHRDAFMGKLPDLINFPDNRIFIGDSVRLGKNIQFGESVVIGKSSIIGDNVWLNRVVVMPDSIISSNTHISDAIVYDGSNILCLEKTA